MNVYIRNFREDKSSGAFYGMIHHYYMLARTVQVNQEHASEERKVKDGGCSTIEWTPVNCCILCCQDTVVYKLLGELSQSSIFIDQERQAESSDPSSSYMCGTFSTIRVLHIVQYGNLCNQFIAFISWHNTILVSHRKT